MRKNDTSWQSGEKNRIRQLNRKIAKDCNYMWALMIVLIPVYLLVLFLAVHVERVYFHASMEALSLLFGFLKYSSITEVWSRISEKKNLTAAVTAFPVSRRGILLSHVREILFNQLGMAVLTIFGGMIFRWSVAWSLWDGLFLLGAFVNTGIVIVIKDGVLSQK